MVTASQAALVFPPWSAVARRFLLVPTACFACLAIARRRWTTSPTPSQAASEPCQDGRASQQDCAAGGHARRACQVVGGHALQHQRRQQRQRQLPRSTACATPSATVAPRSAAVTMARSAPAAPPASCGPLPEPTPAPASAPPLPSRVHNASRRLHQHQSQLFHRAHRPSRRPHQHECECRP